MGYVVEVGSFVGRGDALASLEALLAVARAGTTTFAVIVGEPGIGKSRLAEETCRAAARHGVAAAWGRAFPTSETLAYAPVTELLRSPAIRASLDRLDPAWRMELQRILPELEPDRAPAPLTAPWQRLRLFEAMARAVLATRDPQIIVVDDLQWCDQETLDWLAFLLRFDPRAPLLLVATARAGDLVPEHPVTRWVAATAHTRVELGPLSRDETAELAASVAGTALDAGAADRMFRQTEGNPLFVVESVRAGGSDARIAAVMTARLSQLSSEAREVIEVAATIGRGFTLRWLEAACERGEAAVVRALDEAWARRLIKEDDAGYAFAHDRLREAALAGIGPARRQLLHRVVAQGLERTTPRDLHTAAAEIAHHYDRAGRPTEAIDHYERAAAGARRVYANSECVALLERALELNTDPSRELGLLLALGGPLVSLRGYGAPRVLTVYERVQELCAAAGVVSAPALRAFAIAFIVRGRLRDAEAIGDRLATMVDDPAAIVEADYVLGVTRFWLGRFGDAIAHLDRSALATGSNDQLAIHREFYAQDPDVICGIRSAVALWHVGSPDRAFEASDRLLALARSRSHPFGIGYVLNFKTLLHVLNDDARAGAVADESLEFARAHDMAYWYTQAHIFVGWCRRDRAQLEYGLAQAREWGIEIAKPFYLGLRARLECDEGRVDAARATVDEALAIARGRDERWAEAHVLRVRAEVERIAGDRAAATAALLAALAVATVQGARTLERRIRDDLAALDPAASVDEPDSSLGTAFAALLGALARPPPDHGLAPGSRVGRYRVVELIGRGGMGAVYRARDDVLGRDVALKLIAAGAIGPTVDRFRREIVALASVRHENVVAVHDAGVDEARPYVVLDLVEGQTLRERLRAGPLGVADATRLARDLVSGLAAAHAAGVVHRDLKPDNIVIEPQGTAKLVDFGLARLIDRPDAPDLGLTESGAMLGTARYMAPEQVRGEPVDHRADLFALGAVLLEALTGRYAFDGACRADVITAILRDEPVTEPALLADERARHLLAIALRCLEKAPERRFQSAVELLAALGR